MKKKQNIYIIFYLTIFVSCASFAGENPSAQEFVKKADEVRNPKKPFRLDNKLTEYQSGLVNNNMSLVVYSKEDETSGQYKSVVIYKEPARDLGKTVLLNGTKMWFYDPSSKASVRISPQQRLIGQASEGDVVTVNLAKDYQAKLLGQESLEDADHKKKKCWHLDLSPAKDDAVYNRIEYWVEEGTYYPVKGKFYSDSGRLLKIAYYHNYEMQMGALRPTEVIIIDAVNSKMVTTMNFSNYREKIIPENWFQRDFLSHLKVD